MSHSNSITELLGATDIYLIDQIMKGRYQLNDTILDAGCGYGRNLHWFLRENFRIYGVDREESAISDLKNRYPALPEESFQHSSLEDLPFADSFFDHVICSAVLHFAKSTDQFHSMLSELVRVLKPAGMLFIRMTADIGIEDKVHLLENGVYAIPDGSNRFLLTRPLLSAVMNKYRLSFLEPFKTVNVDDVRCMSTLILTK